MRKSVKIGRHRDPNQCLIWAPVAILLLPYAMVRLAIDTWNERRR